MTRILAAALLPLSLLAAHHHAAPLAGCTGTQSMKKVSVSAEQYTARVTANACGRQLRAGIACGVSGGGLAWNAGNIVKAIGRRSQVYCPQPGSHEQTYEYGFYANYGTAAHPSWRWKRQGYFTG